MIDNCPYIELGQITTTINGLWTGKKPPFQTVAVIRNTNFSKDCKLKMDDVAMIEVESKQFATRKLQVGDIIIEKSGGSDKQPVGRPILFNIKDGDYSFSNFTATLRVNNKDEVLPEYLHKFLYGFYLTGKTAAMQSKTTGLHNLDFNAFKRILVPVPSPEIQQLIIDELNLLEGIIEKKNEQLKTLDRLAETIFFEMFRDIQERTPLSALITELTGGKSLAGDEENPNKVLKTGAVTYDYFRGDDIKNLPLDYQPNKEDLVKQGDVLISRMNTADLVGACAYVWDVKPNIYLPDRLWRMKLKDRVNPIYLWKALIQLDAKQQIRSLASGTSGTMKNISKPKLLSVEIPKVDFDLQLSFASKIIAIEKQKKLINESIKPIEQLLASRMDKFFSE